MRELNLLWRDTEAIRKKNLLMVIFLPILVFIATKRPLFLKLTFRKVLGEDGNCKPCT